MDKEPPRKVTGRAAIIVAWERAQSSGDPPVVQLLSEDVGGEGREHDLSLPAERLRVQWALLHAPDRLCVELYPDETAPTQERIRESDDESSPGRRR